RLCAVEQFWVWRDERIPHLPRCGLRQRPGGERRGPRSRRNSALRAAPIFLPDAAWFSVLSVWTPFFPSRIGCAILPPMQAALDAILRRFITLGRLTVRWPDGRLTTYAGPSGSGPEAGITLRDAATVRRLTLNPALAVGEAYMDG